MVTNIDTPYSNVKTYSQHPVDKVFIPQNTYSHYWIMLPEDGVDPEETLAERREINSQEDYDLLEDCLREGILTFYKMDKQLPAGPVFLSTTSYGFVVRLTDRKEKHNETNPR